MSTHPSPWPSPSEPQRTVRVPLKLLCCADNVRLCFYLRTTSIDFDMKVNRDLTVTPSRSRSRRSFAQKMSDEKFALVTARAIYVNYTVSMVVVGKFLSSSKYASWLTLTLCSRHSHFYGSVRSLRVSGDAGASQEGSNALHHN